VGRDRPEGLKESKERPGGGSRGRRGFRGQSRKFYPVPPQWVAASKRPVRGQKSHRGYTAAIKTRLWGSGMARDLTWEGENDVKGVPVLIPLFPATSFVPGSPCPHHGPIPPGSDFVCMRCHQSGRDGHPIFQGVEPLPLDCPKCAGAGLGADGKQFFSCRGSGLSARGRAAGPSSAPGEAGMGT